MSASLIASKAGAQLSAQLSRRAVRARRAVVVRAEQETPVQEGNATYFYAGKAMYEEEVRSHPRSTHR
jgi:hypothetical protein